jgi:hypothetical protein
MNSFRNEHQELRLDPEARNMRHTHITIDGKKSWRIQQMLVDPEEHNDWVAEFTADLQECRHFNAPILHLIHLGPFA